MYPTLRPLDSLSLVPYNCREVRAGDVVVFPSPERRQKIVHRVISVDSCEIRTRGDNNTRRDPWVLRPEKILGRVVFAERGDRRIPIQNDRAGRHRAALLRGRVLIRSGIVMLLRPVYYQFSKIGYLNGLSSVCSRMKVISFNRPFGIELQLFMDGRIVGRLYPERNEWHISFPFKLFVDMDMLPRWDAENKTEPD